MKRDERVYGKSHIKNIQKNLDKENIREGQARW